jgi:putative intracellular protease/amidase
MASTGIHTHDADTLLRSAAATTTTITTITTTPTALRGPGLSDGIRQHGHEFMVE